MTLLTWMAYSALVAALLGAAAWVLERALLALGRPARWLWILALVGAVGIPLVTLMRYGVTASHSWGEVNLYTLEEMQPFPIPPTTPTSTGPMVRVLGRVSGTLTEGIRHLFETFPRPGLSDGTLGVLWGGVALLLFLVLGGSTVRLGLRLRRWPARRLLGTDGVRVTPGLGPAVVGAFRPSIVLPTWALELEERHLGLVLLHEREHVSARDTLVLAIAAALALACFWNPALWWMLGRLRSAVEMDCDARVLARGVPPREYGALLLEVGARGTRLPLHMAALAEPADLLERRLRQMGPSNLRPKFQHHGGGYLFVPRCFGWPVPLQLPAYTVMVFSRS